MFVNRSLFHNNIADISTTSSNNDSNNKFSNNVNNDGVYYQQQLNAVIEGSINNGTNMGSRYSTPYANMPSSNNGQPAYTNPPFSAARTSSHGSFNNNDRMDGMNMNGKGIPNISVL